MDRPPYQPVEKSFSHPGEIVDRPSNGEAIGVRLNDPESGFSGFLIEWKHNLGAWISGDNNVSLSGEV